MPCKKSTLSWKVHGTHSNERLYVSADVYGKVRRCVNEYGNSDIRYVHPYCQPDIGYAIFPSKH